MHKRVDKRTRLQVVDVKLSLDGRVVEVDLLVVGGVADRLVGQAERADVLLHAALYHPVALASRKDWAPTAPMVADWMGWVHRPSAAAAGDRWHAWGS
jgi:hypothetical protein